MKYFSVILLLTLSFALESKKVSFNIIYNITPNGSASIKLTSLIPKTLKHRQTIQSMSYSIKPVRVFDNDGNRYAVFSIQDFAHKTNIVISVKAVLYRWDLETALKVSNTESLSSSDRQKYLQAEKYIEVNHPFIQKAARSIKGDTEIDIVKGVFDFVVSTVRYAGYIPEDTGAVKTLTSKKADCDGYVDLFVALCRAKGIPARCVDGITIRPSEYPQHAWAEVYLYKLDWIPFDISRKKYSALKPYYITLSSVRLDRTLNNYHYFTCVTKGKIKLKSKFISNLD